ncbi:hypothetical protein CEUSTIGMA_g8453.t1 [Chlamydomonas eustigma]|uniref:BRCT domain-containing protein n=1 Tax=Chlamydomonas eustigma TaxID=1157962 RepID=A0A250XD56_9CHLO|nr:hypothetical protein CEUSTIGMA_g8453.t1 [Chlamydomonas eustigma]|eukprot:GAX81018.1 hypothetical protein CEUSTIGMA_g8453.t1 [Chlamydomonas eustigma]
MRVLNWACGLVFTTTGLGKSLQYEIQKDVEKSGGRYTPALTKKCTHILVDTCNGNQTTEKLRSVFSDRLTWKQEVVTIQWLAACMLAGALVDCSPFRVMSSKVEEGDIHCTLTLNNEKGSGSNTGLLASVVKQPQAAPLSLQRKGPAIGMYNSRRDNPINLPDSLSLRANYGDEKSELGYDNYIEPVCPVTVLSEHSELVGLQLTVEEMHHPGDSGRHDYCEHQEVASESSPNGQTVPAVVIRPLYNYANDSAWKMLLSDLQRSARVGLDPALASLTVDLELSSHYMSLSPGGNLLTQLGTILKGMGAEICSADNVGHGPGSNSQLLADYGDDTIMQYIICLPSSLLVRRHWMNMDCHILSASSFIKFLCYSGSGPYDASSYQTLRLFSVDICRQALTMQDNSTSIAFHNIDGAQAEAAASLMITSELRPDLGEEERIHNDALLDTRREEERIHNDALLDTREGRTKLVMQMKDLELSSSKRCCVTTAGISSAGGGLYCCHDNLMSAGPRTAVQSMVFAPASLLQEVWWTVSIPPNQNAVQRTSSTPSTSLTPWVDDLATLRATNHFDDYSRATPLHETAGMRDASQPELLGLSTSDLDEVVIRVPALTLLLPRDELGVLGHAVIQVHGNTSRSMQYNTPNSTMGGRYPPRRARNAISLAQILWAIYEHYNEALDASMQLEAMQEDISLRKMLQVPFLKMHVVRRVDLLGPLCSFGGLTRCSRDHTVAAYQLFLNK